MKIVDVKTFIVGTPADERGTHHGGPYWCFVKLLTDEGIHGWGEATKYRLPHSIIPLFNEVSKRFILNKVNPFNIEKLFDTLSMSVMETQVIAAFEIACWDIIGKALNQPIYNLLGGKFNEKLRSYTYLYKWRPGDPPEEAGPAVANLVKEGFTAVKFDPIATTPAPRQISLDDLNYSEKVVKNIRDTIGDKCDILIGTHAQLNTSGAIRFAKMLEKYRPLWFEEPIPGENKEEMARLAQHTSIPIANGESVHGKHEFKDMLEKRAAQIIQVNVGINGILESKKIASISETYYAQIAPWVFCGPIAAGASVQLDVCSPNFLLQESLETGGGFFNKLVKNPTMKWENGYLIPPTGPNTTNRTRSRC
jgi:2-dehydro-3-deoxyphosphogalactonate aldolase